MKIDHFWETFWLACIGIMLLSIMGSGAIFFFHIQNINAAAVGVSFDPNKDPFESTTYRAGISITDGYAYRNALPLGLRQWSWDSVLDWTATAEAYEGSASLKMVFEKPWAGMGMGGFSVSRNANRSLSLAVYPDAQVGDLYIEVYDDHGVSLGRQSLGWYAPSGSLTPNAWQYLSVPLENLIGSSTTKTITGISISTKNAGVAYADAIQFSSNVVSHALWVMPQSGGPPYNPFATSTPVALPYTATFDTADFSRWYSYYGLFAQMSGAFVIGPKVPDNTDSISVYRLGHFWTDYKVDATLDWGISSVFSLLVRFADAGNFVSCAFSYYGETAQIYLVKNGVSTQLAQTPGLAVKDYNSPWQNVAVGASVEGNRVSCYTNGEKVLSADIPSLPTTGTVGLEAWDQNVYSSPHTLHALQVKPLLGE